MLDQPAFTSEVRDTSTMDTLLWIWIVAASACRNWCKRANARKWMAWSGVGIGTGQEAQYRKNSSYDEPWSAMMSQSSHLHYDWPIDGHMDTKLISKIYHFMFASCYVSFSCRFDSIPDSAKSAVRLGLYSHSFYFTLIDLAVERVPRKLGPLNTINSMCPGGVDLATLHCKNTDMTCEKMAWPCKASPLLLLSMRTCFSRSLIKSLSIIGISDLTEWEWTTNINRSSCALKIQWIWAC